MILSNSDKLTYSTVRIESFYNNGSVGYGTGFFFLLKDDIVNNTSVPVIITNKHVVKGAQIIRLLFVTADENNHPLDNFHFPVILEKWESFCINHPDPNVDLCAIAMGPFLREIDKQKQKIFYLSLDSHLIPTLNELKEMQVMEEIVMVGYPNGIYDQFNNKPLIRRGITSTHPMKDYNSKKEFVIDAACFPGSSGSPVFLFNQGSYSKSGGIVLGTRLKLLGILYAGPQIIGKGDIKIVDIPTSQRQITEIKMMMNLGLVIRSERIMELEALIKT